ncbi:MAG: hypothetical protein JSV56_09215 [Methanomassiliicoccales archaeon]|nr:MAG: hypothetical protein JSV56_09215 [Methanomassiliicoccales archaeon]
MIKIRCRGGLLLISILSIIFLVSHTLLGPSPFLQEVTADHREFEVEKFDVNITISPDSLQYIDMNLQDGEEFEVVYTLQVKENLPIDIWFVSEDNYLLLVNDAQFLYYFDGTEKQVTYTTKFVSVTKTDLYKLVMTNYYNNQTVEINIKYEIRTYITESAETPSEDSSNFLYSLLFVVVILAVIIIFLLFKNLSYKEALSKGSHKKSSKRKAKSKKAKKTKPKGTPKETLKKKAKPQKAKKAKSVITDKASSKKRKIIENEEEFPDKLSPSFCGYCGEPVRTPYCKKCGRKV